MTQKQTLDFIKQTFKEVKDEKGGPDETYAMWRIFFETLVTKHEHELALVSSSKLLEFVCNHFAKIDDELDVLCSHVQIREGMYESTLTPNGYQYDEIWNDDERIVMAKKLRNIKIAFIYNQVNFFQGFLGINKMICKYALDYY